MNLALEPRSVEFLIAWEDGTWTTAIHGGVTGDPVDCAQACLNDEPQYRKAILFAPYCDPEPDMEER